MVVTIPGTPTQASYSAEQAPPPPFVPTTGAASAAAPSDSTQTPVQPESGAGLEGHKLPFTTGPIPRFRKPTPAKFYLVTKCPDQALVGLHYCVWQDLEARLPTGKLIGSGTSLKGYFTASEASARWAQLNPGVPLRDHRLQQQA